MIFADKLIQLRKKSGWSQEELAEQINVTRQSISKWEGAQSVPDLKKMVRLSELFGVSTDYLLKDEIEETEYLSFKEEAAPLKRVSMEEANAFLSVKTTTSKWVAYATLLCILSPLCLFVLGAMSETPAYGLSDDVAAGAGMIVLLVLIAIAVAIYISSGSKNAPFEYLEKEAFETEYGVSGMVEKRKENYKSKYTANNIIGVCLCVLSVIPLFTGVFFNDENELFLALLLSLTFIFVGVGVVFLIRNGIIWASYEKLLQEGDYTKEKKRNHSVATAVYITYWLIATAGFLAYSLTTNGWGHSWIVWVVAGVLFPAVAAITNALDKRR